jgi:hypothetical protein
MSTGFGGYEVNRATAAEVELSVRKMARFHARHGTTARALCAQRQPDDSGEGRAHHIQSLLPASEVIVAAGPPVVGAVRRALAAAGETPSLDLGRAWKL